MRRMILGLTAALLCLTGCHNRDGGRFHIDGLITQAADSTLYLEHLGMDGVVVTDSVRLDEEGRFAFSGARPFNPEFYRLRIADRIINLSIDSTETVSVEATFPDMSSNYRIEGSADCEAIRDISLRLQTLQRNANRVAQDRSLTVEERNDSVRSLINGYKLYLKGTVILKNPASAAAYFAVFQTVGNTLLFNPVSEWDDVRYIAAVATAWDARYPETTRTENLHNIALQGMKNARPNRPFELAVDPAKIEEVGLIDIALKDIRGNTRRLSDLKGKVVLLDFTVYAGPQSQERIMNMRTIYNRYRERGLEIYQVSLDPNEHYWKTACEQLPWICVYDPEGSRSDYVTLYRLNVLPCYFLIDRNAELRTRSEYVSDINKALEELL